ncbi:hypothetical protein RB653_006975 [Dictyostelium firmibasis]|uniref:Uncharacterized protein n=1 Tax=Dictyostelium firmibasis TaxID=79012 RepID=A0AAN7YQS7_9MYCE
MKFNFLFFIFIFIIFFNLINPIKGQNNTTINEQNNELKSFKNESNLIFSSYYYKIVKEELNKNSKPPTTSKKDHDNEKSRFCLSIKEEASSEQVSKLYSHHFLF